MKARTALICSGVAAIGWATLSAASLHRRRQGVRNVTRRIGSERRRSDQLAAVAHELRTPLNSIVNWVSVLQSGEADAAQSAIALRSIAASARAQGRLIEDLLDAARSERDQMPLRRAAIDVRAPLESAVDVIRPSADAAHLYLSITLPGTACTICGDVDRLQQAFGNVLSNALKFTDRGGIRVDAVKCDSYVEVRIVDSGKGIERDFLPHVFEQFEQADRSTRRQAGLGLGLAICRDLIMRHDGTIDVTSEGAGKGTTVTIRLPLLRETTGASAAVSKP
jgi:signal transduction histidine kinase